MKDISGPNKGKYVSSKGTITASELKRVVEGSICIYAAFIAFSSKCIFSPFIIIVIGRITVVCDSPQRGFLYRRYIKIGNKKGDGTNSNARCP